ncbi:MAG: methylenetetrahydrofolate reductase [NAD(P)H] [Proteobacteria bacterium]|jgi:methylenetetrahydrofolate reductase (NADPH)|uniref:Methylenetetrahydrofolate reductase n=1 Tax=Candidatus Fonsibacter lacus TaxID=2576439 RepID=A0A964UYP3_9PROT|nr:methylenetetrahydrofolate reductase [NAD(P)H] [Candidatus Fonsibacter lacus]
MSKDLNISFEFFPAKDDVGHENLWKSLKKLEQFSPKFFSVTFGAGGGERDKSDFLVKKIHNKSNTPVAGHLTCVDMSKEEINSIALDWLRNGINKIVALRGDVRKKNSKYIPHKNGYANAADMVSGLKKLGNFQIAVAGYPEKHPDSENEIKDLENLKNKADQGADKIITQFFFNYEKFLKFRDAAINAGVKIPIIPGILPVDNFEKIKNFSKKCGTSIPTWIEEEFAGLENDNEIQKIVGASIACDLVKKLQVEGVNEFHFYTLNKYELSYAVCKRLISDKIKNKNNQQKELYI